jgi:hypothetical protein
MILYIIFSFILTFTLIAVLLYNKNNTSGYNCQNKNCIFVKENSEFRTKNDCSKFCKKPTKTVKTSKESNTLIKQQQKTYICDKSNCVCTETDKNSQGPIYKNYNTCQLNCNNCHDNLYNSYAIKPNYYYSTIPNINYHNQIPYNYETYEQDPYTQYPYGLEPPPIYNRPPLCEDKLLQY